MSTQKISPENQFHFPKFQTFLGVDQTGAARAGGQKAAPLKAFVIRRSQDTQVWKGEPLFLESLSRKVIDQHFGVNSQLAMIVDSVLGLPHACWPRGKKVTSQSLWKLFRETQVSKGFGRSYSETHFLGILKRQNLGSIPSRLCEEIVQANSLFRTRPFQRNIQTGTFRIWRDLSAHEINPWCYFWPYDLEKRDCKDLPWIFEGYPSWLWKNLFFCKIRSPSKLNEIFAHRVVLKKSDLNRVQSDSDFADAAILAYSGLLLQESNRLLAKLSVNPKIKRRMIREGWLLGLDMGEFLREKELKPPLLDRKK